MTKKSTGVVMADEKDSWTKLWELMITILAIYFASYTMAKDYVNEYENFNHVLLYSVLFWVVLMVVVLLSGILFYKILRKYSAFVIS